MSTTEANTAVEELLKSFDLLPELVRHQVASEILRRIYSSPTELDDVQLASLYSEFAETDRKFAEEGIEDYQTALASEDAE